MKTLKDPVFEPETIGDRIADFIDNIPTSFFIALIALTILALITIIGVMVGIAIWGDENVNYWISKLF